MSTVNMPQEPKEDRPQRRPNYHHSYHNYHSYNGALKGMAMGVVTVGLGMVTEEMPELGNEIPIGQ